jgi:hypothetical protein
MIRDFIWLRRQWLPAGCLVAGAFVAACSSTPGSPLPSENMLDASDASDDSNTCATPGAPTPGPTDTHCSGGIVQETNAASCHPDAGADAGGNEAGAGEACPWGATMFGHEGDDDDCKYHVVWTSTPICENTNVLFTVALTTIANGNGPVAGIPGGIIIEAFIPVTLDAACDNQGSTASPSTGNFLTETPAGSGIYQGPVVFNAPGEWTLRFHIHEECADLLPDSPHGHAAFHIDVP